ncbi:MAG: PilN domain-containing protein [Candidatus Omnitrophica bacterium]|nr:PilN domain-containing protein [Candidatus Omnitrophota bacterium]
MIELNLLKKRQEKFYQKVLLIRILSVYIIGFLCLLIILGISYFSNRISIKSTLASIENYNQKIKNEQQAVQILEKYREEMERTAKILFFAQEEYRTRTLWTRRFNIIGNSVPEGIWLSKMSISQTAREEKNQKTLVIEGFVMQGSINAGKLITQFMNNIKNNSGTEFSNITLAEVKQSDKTSKYRSTLFKIECDLRK